METVLEIIKDAGYGWLATAEDNQPRLRPMAFIVVDQLTLWSSTYHVSGKVDEFKHNEKVEVAFLDSQFRQVRIEGRIDISGGPEKKQRLIDLNPKVGKHFSGGDDPKFVHIEIVPTRVRWKGTGFNEYNEVALS